VSGRSTHSDRLRTIRTIHDRYGVTIDPHTADGVKVALQNRDRAVPIVCLETAQPAKFAETIREALGKEPPRPPAFEGIESLPRRFERIGVDAATLKDLIARHAG
jgi:threonine synthase